MQYPVGWAVTVLLLCVVVPVLTRRPVRRVLGRQYERFTTWRTERDARLHPVDEDEQNLWLEVRRRRLFLARDRIEHLLRVDTYMSATRQLGNRLAYEQLVDEIRGLPDSYLPLPYAPVLERRDGGRQAPSAPWSIATPTPTRQVEVLDIGWRGAR